MTNDFGELVELDQVVLLQLIASCKMINLRNGLHRQPKWLLAPLIGYCMQEVVAKSTYFQHTAGLFKLIGSKGVCSNQNFGFGNYKTVRREAKTNIWIFINRFSLGTEGGKA